MVRPRVETDPISHRNEHRSHTAMSTDLTPHGAALITSKNHQKESPDLNTLDVPVESIEQRFLTAWAHWPKHVERKLALVRFKAAIGRRPIDSLVADIICFGDAYKATTEMLYVPALGVWLNHDRWDDDLPAARTPQPAARRLSRAEENWNAGAIFRNPQIELES